MTRGFQEVHVHRVQRKNKSKSRQASLERMCTDMARKGNDVVRKE